MNYFQRIKFCHENFDVDKIILLAENKRKNYKNKIAKFFREYKNKIKNNLSVSNSFENLDIYLFFEDNLKILKNKKTNFFIINYFINFSKNKIFEFFYLSKKRRIVIFVLISIMSYMIFMLSLLIKKKE